VSFCNCGDSSIDKAEIYRQRAEQSDRAAGKAQDPQTKKLLRNLGVGEFDLSQRGTGAQPRNQNYNLQLSELPLQCYTLSPPVSQSAQTMHLKTIRPCFAIGAIVLSAAATQAAQIGSVEEGLTIARERCAACHLVVKEDGRSINEKAPTFARIANIPGMTPSALRAALNTSHSTMPNLAIKDDDADSIVAYILSLRDNQ
jgi:cytochrome c